MASSSSNPQLLLTPFLPSSSIPKLDFPPPLLNPSRRKKKGALAMAAAANSAADKPPRLVTFLGKGGSGKTTSAVFAAQHYAMAGLKTYLVIHSQDPTAEYLLNCKIGTSPVACNANLSAVRLETTKMLLKPLNRLKEADTRLNMTQGILEEVVGQELGVLPGMDSIFSVLELERLIGFFGNVTQGNSQKEKFDIIIYDGMSTEEMIRMIGATSKARLYLKYLRKLAEKTDFGRLAGPSLLRFVDEAMSLSGRNSNLNGKMSSEIWDFLDQTLERGSSIIAEPDKFGCYVVVDPKSSASLASALRYWGCVIQAGAQVSGALAFASPNDAAGLREKVDKSFSPLPYTFIPHLSVDTRLEWNHIMQDACSEDARKLLAVTSHGTRIHPVKFDPTNKTVTLLMPGFDKSEIKLYQFRGGSELLVEAGDQRRAIFLPSKLQGKVVAAKFIERSLVITMQ
ncbi:uncharacterized protein At1g26090, chloroplastic [Ipomoea triloba]|uniref:uncharacterized protein At1g26090, chloroplastic n=1 Tax=Ipomoea triloba TaxID=35885 RepID=UPI00125E32C7|nr:uncharacterized protein At1g26090, chloroplastic [Ipomoea triloba]